jgi:type IV pilus assembly protein PilW
MVSAVQVALVVRNNQFERTTVTAAAPAWYGTTAATPVLIDLTNDTSWQNYRYKVYQTNVPLRNTTWLGAQSGC